MYFWPYLFCDLIQLAAIFKNLVEVEYTRIGAENFSSELFKMAATEHGTHNNKSNKTFIYILFTLGVSARCCIINVVCKILLVDVANRKLIANFSKITLDMISWWN